MSDLKAGDICVIVLSNTCEQCAKLQGQECTVVNPRSMDVRLSCNGGLQLGLFVLCEVSGKHYNLLRSELRKKDPPKDDSAPRSDFTPADGDFVQDLQRRLAKEHA